MTKRNGPAQLDRVGKKAAADPANPGGQVDAAVAALPRFQAVPAGKTRSMRSPENTAQATGFEKDD
jgi:hypothetical protein